MQRFAEYFVGTIFYNTFRGDVAALRGRQLNLLRSACEVVYQDATALDRQDRQTMEEQAQEAEESD
jgi:CRISPR-associated protein Csc3